MTLALAPVPEALAEILSAFGVSTALVRAEPVAGGHIHESFLLHLADGAPPLFLQRLNTRVYPDPGRLMENVAAVSRHVRAALEAQAAAAAEGASGASDPRRLGPELRLTPAGAPFLNDAVGGCWRLFSAVPDVRVVERVETPRQARAAAAAFGRFFAALNAGGGPVLHETIPGFHDTPARLEALEAAALADPLGRAGSVGSELSFLRSRRAAAGQIVALLADGTLPRRAVHNDPKPTNLLLDAASGEPLCVIDLDNAMPGSALFDFGDMLRAMSSPTDEDELRLDRVGVRTALFEALADGWLAEAGPLLVRAELAHLVDSGWTITLEQGARFLTDHLLGDLTYRTAREGHNLDRCRTQLRLVASFEAQRDELEASLEALRLRHRLPREPAAGGS